VTQPATTDLSAPGTEDRRRAAPLNIVLVEFLPSGGMFQFSFQLAEALAAAGHSVRLLTGPDPELGSTTAGLQVVQAFPTWHPNGPDARGTRRRQLRRVWRAVLLIESWRRVVVVLHRSRPDVAQFGEFRYPLDMAAFWVAAHLPGARMLVDVAHNPIPYDVTSANQSVEKTGRLTRWLLSAAYAACDLVLVLGEGPRGDLLAHFPRVRRTAVAGHGTYASVLPPARTAPPSAAPPHALFFGSWTRYKNIPLMLDAFALVRRQLPEAGLTLAGPVMPDVDLEAIRAQAERIGNVDLRPGYVDLADLPELFDRHRVVLFTYETVNISGSVHMAYTFGRPVVATDVGSMADAVEHGETGLLTAPDAAAVAEGILLLLRDPATADRMGRAAALRAQQGASWSAVADRALAAYHDTLPPVQTRTRIT
jgi:glycosyltransferase involved in cell wall biosynthesis